MSGPSPSAPTSLWLAQIADAIEEMPGVWDADTQRVIYANPAFQRFWGLDARKLGPGPEALVERIHADDRERIRRARASLDRAPYSEEFRADLPAKGSRQARTARIREQAFRTAG